MHGDGEKAAGVYEFMKYLQNFGEFIEGVDEFQDRKYEFVECLDVFEANVN
jgi:hypothetical protein